MEKRPKIPRNVAQQVLIEAGYRCAVPTCRFPITEKAHIVSWAETQNHSFSNLIALCPNCHTLYDGGQINKQAIIAYKKRLIFLSEIYSRFEIDVLDYLKVQSRCIVPGEIIIKRLLDEQLVEIEETVMWQSFDDGAAVPSILSVVLTDKGKEFLQDLNKVGD